MWGVERPVAYGVSEVRICLIDSLDRMRKGEKGKFCLHFMSDSEDDGPVFTGKFVGYIGFGYSVTFC